MQKHTRSDRFTPAVKPAVTMYADNSPETRKCHYCKKTGNTIRHCRKKKIDDAHKSQNPVVKQVTFTVKKVPKKIPDPHNLIFFSDLDGKEAVKQITVTNSGSKTKHA